MKLCNVEDLVGDEVVAKTVMTNDYQILLSEGTIIRKSYIRKLKEYQIESIYIRGNDIHDSEGVKVFKKDMEVSFRNRIQEVLEQHIYGENENLKEMTEIANVIISSIMANPKVLEQVYEIRERSQNLYTHSLNVSVFSIILALHFNMDANRTHELAVSALLHDMGFRYIPSVMDGQNVLPINANNKEEYEKHTVYAYTSLENAAWLSEHAKKMILLHHESADGQGYPTKTSKLSSELMILCVCEFFDEMISGIGQPHIPVAEAIENLRSMRDIRYSSRVTDAFLKYIAAFPIRSRVQLSDGSIGIVVKQNPGFPERPIVQIVGVNGYRGPTRDLIHDKNITIIG